MKTFFKPTGIKIVTTVFFLLVLLSLPFPPAADSVTYGYPFTFREYTGFSIHGLGKEECNPRLVGECSATLQWNYPALVVDVVLFAVIGWFLGFCLEKLFEKFPATRFILLLIILIILILEFLGNI